MTKQSFFAFCRSAFGTEPDYPFDADTETAVLRHADSRRWFAILMRVPKQKFGIDGDGSVDTVNLKLPVEMFGSFGKADGVYPAYHMNKLHWISVLLPEASDSTVEFLTNVSFEATKHKPRGSADQKQRAGSDQDTPDQGGHRKFFV